MNVIILNLGGWRQEVPKSSCTPFKGVDVISVDMTSRKEKSKTLNPDDPKSKKFGSQPKSIEGLKLGHRLH